PDPGGGRARERIVLVGEQPSAAHLPPGCVFADRCPLRPTLPAEVQELCLSRRPALADTTAGIGVACHAVAEHAAAPAGRARSELPALTPTGVVHPGRK